MMVRTEATDGAWRCADYCTRFAAPHIRAVGPRTHVDGVLQRGWHGTIMLRGDEQHCVGAFDVLAECGPGRGWTCVLILIVNRHLADLDNVKFQRSRSEVD